MNFLQTHYYKTIKRELLNKFSYKKINNIPELTKIVLNFKQTNKHEFEYFATLFLAFELITHKSGNFTISKKSNIKINIKRGSPIGLKLILKKKRMYNFLIKLIIEILPKLKNLKNLKFSDKNNINFLSYQLNNNTIFFEFENNFFLFKNLPKLNLTFVNDAKNKNESLFIFHSFRIKT